MGGAGSQPLCFLTWSCDLLVALDRVSFKSHQLKEQTPRPGPQGSNSTGPGVARESAFQPASHFILKQMILTPRSEKLSTGLMSSDAVFT